MERYHFVQIVSSQSKMHRLRKMLKDCTFTYPKDKICLSAFSEVMQSTGEIEGVADVYMQSWINELERIVYEKQNSGTCTAHSGRCSNSITENDGVPQTGVQNPDGNTQVQDEE